jgi:hypothetical protein
MAAGLGYKEFATGDVLTAADANGYLASQVVMVFASAAARTSAITSPQEGMISYLKDTNSTEYYSGSAWVAIGGSASPLTTKGDLYTFSTVNARLGVGTNNQVLTADSAEATGLKWATPAAAASGLTLISATAIGSAVASVTVSSAFSSTYDEYLIMYELGTLAASGNISLQLGSNTSYRGNIIYMADTATTVSGANYNTSTTMFVGYANTDGGSGSLLVSNPNKAKKTVVQGATTSFVTTQSNNVLAMNYYDTLTTQHTAFTIASTQNMTGGNIRVYGYQKS